MCIHKGGQIIVDLHAGRHVTLFVYQRIVCPPAAVPLEQVQWQYAFFQFLTGGQQQQTLHILVEDGNTLATLRAITLARWAVGLLTALLHQVKFVILYVVLPTVQACILIDLELQLDVAFGVHVPAVLVFQFLVHTMDCGECQDKLSH